MPRPAEEITRMVVTLPSDMDEWIASRMESEGFHSADAFIADVVQRERERAFEDAITLGEASGISPRTFDEIIADVRSRLTLL